ncbi:hypothetical protein [Marinobacter oulmenensis]|uniref:Tryptophan synthase subunit beta like protein n=1 Tax=Marinobacter oulmenensis TaxID=643747 RepID=A0A840U8J7_9GAMM|nr:hypothetical protein [Marinobacter oulmenensis]MBB5321449.1 hypothetical protein [Marinobacter oulmenensis]
MFIKRDSQGRIIAVSKVEQSGFDEQLPTDNEELLAFLSSEDDPENLFRKSDAELIRVIEDLVDILTAKGVFQYTELPLQVRQKLNSRKALRSNQNSLDLLDDNPDDMPWP